MFRRHNKLILGLAFLSGLAIVILGELPGNSLLWREAQNTAHVLAFGILSIISLFLVRTTTWINERGQACAYLIAAMTGLLAGIAVEFIQLGVGRDAELFDVLRDVIGTISFLGIYAYFDVTLKKHRANQGKAMLLGIFLLSSTLLIAGLAPFFSLTYSYYQRNASFPELINFNKRWPQAFIATRRAVLKIVDTPDLWQPLDQQRVGQLTVFPARYPRLILHEPVPDWSDYSHLSFHIYAETDQPFKLVLRINDRQHNQEYEDRYTTSFMIMHGANPIRIPLDEIQNGPVDRELDMQSIDKLMLFAVEPDQPVQFYLGNFNLE